MISEEWLPAAPPVRPGSFLPPPPAPDRYPSTKALQGCSPLSPPLFIFHDVIRARSEMSRSLQGKYLSECHRESRGGETTILLSSVFHCQACEDPTLGDFPACGCFCRVFFFLWSYWFWILMAGCKVGVDTSSHIFPMLTLYFIWSKTAAYAKYCWEATWHERSWPLHPGVVTCDGK